MRRLTTVLTTAACAAGVIVAAPSAVAATHPRVSLRPASTQISATGKATFGYHGKDLRKGTRIALQSLDDGTWDTIAKSAHTHGTVDGKFRIDGPGGPGKFTLRVAALRDGKIDTVSARHLIYAYAKIKLSALCHGVLNKSLTARGNNCNTGSVDVGDGTTFHSVMSTSESTPDQGFVEQFGAAGTSCRSINLRFVPDVRAPETLAVRQPGVATQKHTSSGSGVYEFFAKLTGTKFAVSVAQDDNDLFTEFNGSASCYTIDGKA